MSYPTGTRQYNNPPSCWTPDNSHSDLMSTGLTCLRKNAQASSGHGSTASGYTSSRHGSGLQDHFYRTLRTPWPWTGIPVVARPTRSAINRIADPPTLLTPSTPTHSDMTMEHTLLRQLHRTGPQVISAHTVSNTSSSNTTVTSVHSVNARPSLGSPQYQPA